MSPVVKQGQFSDRLAGYVEVRERIKMFYEKFPDGRLVTASVSASTDPDGKPRVWVEAKAYRTPDDPVPSSGWSWMELPGATNYTRGSELENTETSAWGRAIGALGIGIDKSIASAQEVRNKEGGPAPAAPTDGSLIGVAEVGKGDADFELRQTADRGYRVGFRLVDGRKGIKSEAFGPLAEMVAANRPAIEGARVTCWGTVRDETFTKDGKTISYQVLTIQRLRVGALDLSAPDVEPDAPTTVDSVFDEGWLINEAVAS